MKLIRLIFILLIILVLAEGKARRRSGSKGGGGGGGRGSNSRGSRSQRNSRYNGYDADGNDLGDSGSFISSRGYSNYGNLPNRGQRFIGRNLPTFAETFQSNPNGPSKNGKRTLKAIPSQDFTVLGGFKRVLGNLKSTTLALLILTVSAFGFLISRFVFKKLRNLYYKQKIMTGTNEERIHYRKKMEQTA